MGVWNPQRQERRWIEIDAVPVFAPGQASPTEVYTVFADISERKQAEQDLRDLNQQLEQRVAERTQKLTESETNLRAFFDTIDYFCFILDQQGNILRTNQTVVMRLGYSEQELTGMPVLQLHPPNRREEAGGIVTAMLAGTRSFCPVPLQARDGTLVPVETRVAECPGWTAWQRFGPFARVRRVGASESC
jgi:PAS domain S-box-containing protein